MHTTLRDAPSRGVGGPHCRNYLPVPANLSALLCSSALCRSFVISGPHLYLALVKYSHPFQFLVNRPHLRAALMLGAREGV